MKIKVLAEDESWEVTVNDFRHTDCDSNCRFAVKNTLFSINDSLCSLFNRDREHYIAYHRLPACIEAEKRMEERDGI